MAQRTISILVKNGKDSFDESQWTKDIEIIDHWELAGKDDSRWIVYLIHADDVQSLLDNLQPFLEKEQVGRVTVSTVDTSLPISKQEQEREKEKQDQPWFFSTVSREELYDKVQDDASFNINYLLLVFFATVVGAVALLHDNLAVLIGAMVIAPLLGPNIALGFASVVGDLALAKRALLTMGVGVGMVLGVSFLIGLFYSLPDRGVLIGLTKLGYESLILALCAGAVGVITIAQPMRTNLVGVMVAVALLPPAVATGLFLGNGTGYDAARTGVLVLINIASITLVAQVTFTILHVKRHMRGWLEEKTEEKTYYRYMGLTTSILLMSVILFVFLKEF